MSWKHGFGVLLLLLFALLQAAGQAVFQDVELQILPRLTNRWNLTFGYREQPLLLINHGPETRRVRVEIENQASTATVLPPGATREVRLLFYGIRRSGPSPRIKLTVDGDAMPEELEQECAVPYRRDPRFGTSQEAILVSQGASSFRNEPFKSCELLTAEQPVENWSPRREAYSEFNAVLLTSAEFERLSPEVKRALEEYQRLGGVLLLAAKTKTLSWNPLGLGGGAEFPENAGARKLVSSRWTQVISSLQAMTVKAKMLQQRNRELKDFGRTLVPERDFWLILILLTLFVLVVGPLNFWFCARRKALSALFWTTPLISLFFIGLMLGQIVLREGLVTRVQVAVLTRLEQGESRALTVQGQGIFATYPPEELRFSESAQVEFGELGRTTGARLGVVDGLRFTGAWVSPRTPLLLTLRKSEVRREKLLLEADSGDAPRVVNGLGAEIVKLYYVAPDGRAFRNREPIAAGAAAELTAARRDNGSMDWHTWCQQMLAGEMPGQFEDLQVQRGEYLAELKSSPFAELGFEVNHPEWIRALVSGRLEEAP